MFLCLLLLAIMVLPCTDGQDIRTISSQSEIWNAISSGGSNKIQNGDVVSLASGTYTDDVYHNQWEIYNVAGVDGYVICGTDALSCVLDGEDARQIMNIDGAGTAVMTLSGIKFFRGKGGNFGGAMKIWAGATITIENCAFEANVDHGTWKGGGAIYIDNNGHTLDIYTTTFTGNSAAHEGDDIYLNNGGINFQSTCPESWTGTPTFGASMASSVFNENGEVEGTPQSYGLGNCALDSCSAGRYYSSPVCVDCSSGKWTSQGATSPDDCLSCPAGRYLSNARGESEAAACTVCAAGKWSSGGPACLGCAPGSYLVNSAGVDSDESCDQCGAGKYSQESSETCTDCSTGQYSGTASESCSSCPAGKRLINAAADAEHLACTVCDTGEYSGTASATCSSCAAGRYLNSAATGIEVNACSICAIGTYSGISSASCTICPAGKYNDDDAIAASAHTSCTACPPGKKLEDDGNVASHHNSDEDCRECNPGYYSNDPEGVAFCTECETGKVSPSGASECSFCPAGYDCTGTSTIMCEPGQYSNSNTVGCQPCPKGSACPGGTDERPCDSGTYSPEASQTSCLPCPPGKYQNVDGQDACVECPVGSFCPSKTVSPIDCGSAALFCPPSSASVVPASNGHYTIPATEATTLNRESEVICEVGHACVGGVMFACSGEGQYADEPGLSFCKTSVAGTKPATNRLGVENCPPGRYSLGGTNGCLDCAPGKVSEEGAAGCSNCGKCGPGTYKISDCSESLDTQCELCPQNTFSITGAEDLAGCQVCADGGHSQPGSGYCEQCLTGKYFDEEDNDCKPCPKNTFSLTGASNRYGCEDCRNEGEYSQEGAGYCQACPQYMEYNETTKKCVCLESFIELDDGTCTCNAGETLVNGACISCEDGRYKEHAGTESCTICDTDFIKGAFETVGSKVSPGSCACGAGKFLEPRNPPVSTPAGACVHCSDLTLPQGANCTRVGMSLNTLAVADGFWRSSEESDNLVECETPESCTHLSDDELCAVGHTGPICSVCKEDYSKDSSNVCVSCASASVSIGFYTFCFISSLVAAYVILRRILGKGNISVSAMRAKLTETSDKHWSQKLATKAKILTSFYQIVTKLPSTLAVKYPDVYRTFATALSNVFDFNAIGLISIGCIFPRVIYSFYGSLLVTTVTPIVLSLLLLVVTVCQRRNLDPYAASKLVSSRVGFFFGLTYLVFASTTTMSFTTFLCKTYGDDETEYLIADRGVDCNSDLHKKFELYSYFMIAVYPLGITCLYSYKLWVNREAIKNGETREGNTDIEHIGFLWHDYRPEYWWFEIYECFRRLSFSGMLVFFEPGSAAQLCFSIILSIVSLQVYTECNPFVQPEENDLSKISSFSIFLTLLAAIMIKLKSALVEARRTEFGVLLILVNSLVFAMVGLSIMYKPFYKFVNKLNAKHVHDAPLKEMGEEVHYSVDLFFEYFKQLAKSDAEEGGWTPLDVKDWSGKKKKARVTFVVDDELESVLKDINSIKDRHSKSVGSFLYVIDKGEGWRQIYRAIKMPWPTRHRDLVYTEHTVRGEDGEVLVCSRSSKELSESTLELSLQAGRMRAEMRLGGYLLRPVEGGDKTEVIFLSDTDLKGSFAIGYLMRYVTQIYLRGIVDLFRENAERNKRSGAVSEPPPPPPPLPLVSKALQAMSTKKNGATNPLFAQDGLNVEMGRTIKRQVKKVQKQKKKDEKDIHVL
ncbi:hypothetical protein TrST_g1986 [Triparma strigata]|uniref:Tyrosine-protein kinase ephrin type A/B receptor-like domain-containing protein n=1 Tax=Triparma strigata TaxID=1606541 RepID=A0A9W7ATT5_9STRA|nr:hypothetical protein TrST_g1986 [Triparma strigata]